MKKFVIGVLVFLVVALGVGVVFTRVELDKTKVQLDATVKLRDMNFVDRQDWDLVTVTTAKRLYRIISENPETELSRLIWEHLKTYPINLAGGIAPVGSWEGSYLVERSYRISVYIENLPDNPDGTTGSISFEEKLILPSMATGRAMEEVRLSQVVFK